MSLAFSLEVRSIVTSASSIWRLRWLIHDGAVMECTWSGQIRLCGAWAVPSKWTIFDQVKEALICEENVAQISLNCLNIQLTYGRGSRLSLFVPTWSTVVEILARPCVRIPVCRGGKHFFRGPKSLLLSSVVPRSTIPRDWFCSYCLSCCLFAHLHMGQNACFDPPTKLTYMTLTPISGLNMSAR